MSASTLSPSSANTSTLIQVCGVSKSYGDHAVLHQIDLTVQSGEVVAIIGTSGCGKSTLLKVIAGLEKPNDGEVILGDPNFTLVFQYSALFDSLTVFENVAFSLLESPDQLPPGEKHVVPSLRQMRRKVREKLRMVGLDESIEDQYPNELSGGMQKRVSFARAIMSEPKIILYDEPTSGLDPVASNVLEDYIVKLRDELNVASVVVTHTFSTIYRTANRVCLLHEGRVHWTGTPQELLKTTDPLARAFVQAALVQDDMPS
ncbi:MAG: ATP-binding cassette domain-containing protein [Candidatus Melainabacteria bacterium]|nr:ATP-binding cassette domain-containing protein [Candidatus Melainabacteria bacterium]